MPQSQRYSADDYYWKKQDCPICGRPPAQFIGRRGGSSHRLQLGVEARIWRCEKCDLIFPNPMPIPKNGLAQHYDVSPSEYFYAHDEEHKRKSASRLLDELESLTKTGRLLDVGSGRGELILVARDRGWEVTCVEPSPSFAAVLQARDIDVITSGIEDCSLGSERFDAVILSAVLEHLYEPQLALQKISASLRNGGLLFLDVPNEGGLYFRAGNLYEQIKLSGSTVNLSPTFFPLSCIRLHTQISQGNTSEELASAGSVESVCRKQLCGPKAGIPGCN